MATVPDYLPTPVRLVGALVLGVFGLTVGPFVEVVQGWRNRHLWEGEPDG